MTRFKKLKKAIRSRSRKTGESYTAARRQVLEARRDRSGSPTRGPARPVPVAPRRSDERPEPARTRGAVSDAVATKRTGHGLDHWFAVLDAFGAPAKGHTAAARHLFEEHGVPAWYVQGITVAYERARGLRAMNQACTGKFQVSVSRVVPASVAEVAQVLTDPARRREWLSGADPVLARAFQAAFSGPKPRQVVVKNASAARLRYPWDGGAVEIRVTGTAAGRASVVADNVDLPNAAAVETRRAQWKAALEGLKAYLGR